MGFSNFPNRQGPNQQGGPGFHHGMNRSEEMMSSGERMNHDGQWQGQMGPRQPPYGGGGSGPMGRSMQSNYQSPQSMQNHIPQVGLSYAPQTPKLNTKKKKDHYWTGTYWYLCILLPILEHCL